MSINIVKAVMFAKLDKWFEQLNATEKREFDLKPKPMSIESAKLVDCLELQWSMLNYCYKPAGFCKSLKGLGVKNLRFHGDLENFHHIMIANTYNLLFGFISEMNYLHMVTKGLKSGFVQLEPLNNKDILVDLTKIIERCANNHLISEHSLRSVFLTQSELVYKLENIKFLEYLYHCITEWPREFGPELINAIEKSKFVINPGDKRNLSFFVFLRRLLRAYKNFYSIKLYVSLDLKPMPKCFGLNNKHKERFIADTLLRICSLCYTLCNVYISKSFNRAKIYSDSLLNLTYSCQEKTCKMVSVNLLYYTKNRFIYPSLVWSVNNSTRYTIHLRQSCRTECNIDVYQNDKLVLNPVIFKNKSDTARHHRICLDLFYESHPLPQGVVICDGCRIVLDT